MQSRNWVLTEYYYAHVKVDVAKKKQLNNYRYCEERMPDYILYSRMEQHIDYGV